MSQIKELKEKATPHTFRQRDSGEAFITRVVDDPLITGGEESLGSVSTAIR